jgi:hypothetical protein
MMTLQIEPSMDIGLRHVLETGLSVVRPEQAVEVDDKVLGNLIEIFSEAGRGSEALQQRDSLIGVDERPAFERFALFFRYLKGAVGDDLTNRLSETASVFTGVKNREPVDSERRQRAAELIERLLTAMRREAALARLVAPRSITYE